MHLKTILLVGAAVLTLYVRIGNRLPAVEGDGRNGEVTLNFLALSQMSELGRILNLL